MKKYIRDDGRVRLCASNIAKMNILESMYYHRFRLWDEIKYTIGDLISHLYIFVNLLCIFILPVAYPIMALREIRKAKKEMERYARRHNDTKVD